MKILTRRKFIAGTSMAATGVCLCGVSGCATLTGIGNTPKIKKNAYSISGNTLSINLVEVPELAKVGGSAKILDDSMKDKIIIARIADDRFVAASISCTHRGTEVEYKHEKSLFQCASLGGSKFRLDGMVEKGPADAPLSLYKLTYNGDSLVIET